MMTSLSDVRVKWRISCQQHINFWLSMMSGYGENPGFFNKKVKIGRPQHSLTPTPLRPITSHFSLTPHPPPPSKWTSYMYHPLYKLKNTSINFSHTSLLLLQLHISSQFIPNEPCTKDSVFLALC